MQHKIDDMRQVLTKMGTNERKVERLRTQLEEALEEKIDLAAELASLNLEHSGVIIPVQTEITEFSEPSDNSELAA